jgi:hypothetical protein
MPHRCWCGMTCGCWHGTLDNVAWHMDDNMEWHMDVDLIRNFILLFPFISDQPFLLDELHTSLNLSTLDHWPSMINNFLLTHETFVQYLPILDHRPSMIRDFLWSNQTLCETHWFNHRLSTISIDKANTSKFSTKFKMNLDCWSPIQNDLDHWSIKLLPNLPMNLDHRFFNFAICENELWPLILFSFQKSKKRISFWVVLWWI